MSVMVAMVVEVVVVVEGGGGGEGHTAADADDWRPVCCFYLQLGWCL